VNTPQPVIVSGSFDNLASRQMRFLREAARLGPVRVLLWDDAAVAGLVGRPPTFPQAERRYFLESLRYVDCVTLCGGPIERDALPRQAGPPAGAWVVEAADDTPAKAEECRRSGREYRVIGAEQLRGFPVDPPAAAPSGPPRKKVIVTGCYDWFHTGHVRFFEEVSELGELYVCLGHDANIRLLKGEGHPMFPEQERRFLVQSVRFVHQALITSGHGWLDAEPEIQRIRPDIYAVNDDGDRPEKRNYCQSHGIEYRVLRRTPKPGLPRRQSTDLRGF